MSNWVRNVIVLASLCLFVSLVWCIQNKRLTPSSWNAPTEYYGDAYINLGYIRAVAQGDWTLLGVKHVHRVNAPADHADWQNYPLYEKVPTIALGLVARFTSLALASNIGLLTSVVTAAAAFWVAAFFILRCSRGWSWVGAICFALLYFQSWREMNHLLLCFTWTIPLFVAATWASLRRHWLFLIALLAGISNPYWVLGALILVVACQQSVRQRLWLVTGLAVGFVWSNLVTILYATKLSLLRTYFESERFALKPIELLLPPPGGLFGNLSLHYQNAVDSPWRGEMFSPYLGTVGVAALVFLVHDWIVWRKGSVQFTQVCVTTMCVCIGGLTAAMALCHLDMFRAANRLSEFIAAIVLLYLATRLSDWKLPRHAQIILGGLMVGLACLEFLTFPPRQPAKEAAQKYAEDAKLGKELDVLFPGKSLYSFPPMFFPDDVTFARVDPYTNLRPWIHTSQVSFSFGQAASHLSDFDAETFKQLKAGRINFDRLAKADFGGVIFTRAVFDDHMVGLLSNVTAQVISPDFAVVKLPLVRK